MPVENSNWWRRRKGEEGEEMARGKCPKVIVHQIHRQNSVLRDPCNWGEVKLRNIGDKREGHLISPSSCSSS